MWQALQLIVLDQVHIHSSLDELDALLPAFVANVFVSIHTVSCFVNWTSTSFVADQEEEGHTSDTIVTLLYVTKDGAEAGYFTLLACNVNGIITLPVS